ncbi:hypothetical protein AB0G97_36145 [Streptomyces sp. NPDC020755]|uniref:hypothetical protein n=1 Tax=Streptomyces sp. NPDC020755 TaxID=3154790 RepID=UPI0034090349
MTTHRRPLPAQADVRAAVGSLIAETGRPPSVLALATRLGLANTTFRRNYPDICAELAEQASPPASARAANAFAKATADNARLRRANRDLAEQLELATAVIQRLSIDNHQLREALHQAREVTALPRRR